jgi:hypothetical protein
MPDEVEAQNILINDIPSIAFPQIEGLSDKLTTFIASGSDEGKYFFQRNHYRWLIRNYLFNAITEGHMQIHDAGYDEAVNATNDELSEKAFALKIIKNCSFNNMHPGQTSEIDSKNVVQFTNNRT